MSRLMPRQPVPALRVSTLAGDWDLAAQKPERFTLVVFYRGLHCPICKTYVSELDKLVAEFAARGTGIQVLSSDTRDRAEAARDNWGLANLNLGYGLSIEMARSWGLYVSTSRGKTSAGIEEPALFSEPGLFLVRPDGTLYWGSTSTMPFARPHFREILGGLDFVIKNDYPARGEA
ncbi:MAG: AhpC/TSA family protein [Betaproteobacteria bacterium]|nr:AhpC/TSA family protein [Betaproteobacteria bacterium]